MTGRRIARPDWELARYEGEIPASRLDRTVAEYAVATAIGRAAPAVSEASAGTLEGA